VAGRAARQNYWDGRGSRWGAPSDQKEHHREAHRRESRPRRLRWPLVETEIRRSFGPDTGAPAAARRELERLRNHVGDDLVERCQLVTTELLTNSVRHADLDSDQEIDMEVSVLPGVLRIEVTDPGRGFDREAGTAPEPGRAAGGWGLWLVNELADRWGVEFGRSTRVWSEFDTASTAAAPS
jgi:anti-sigma regulatory factor (Ser/Thr protein kinase)